MLSKLKKISSVKSLYFFGFLGIIFSAVSLTVIFFLGMPSQALYSQDTPATSSHDLTGVGSEYEAIPQTAGLGFPVRLKIPKIYVNASVEYVGLTPSGAVDVPNGPDTVAWFKKGPRPGEIGSAVIDGHYGWGNGKASVFDDLHQLAVGDKIYVENDQGEIIAFVVRGSKKYDPEANASDVFGSDDGEAHLNLVTCGGTWDKEAKNYSKRLIVFADKVTE